MFSKISPVLGLALLALACKATPPASPEQETIDRFLRGLYADSAPGAVILAARDGEVVFHEAYGLANVEADAPMTRDSRFPLASVTKQFTATAIQSLASQGLFSLDDDVSAILGIYPTKSHPVSIRTLLNHTSGVTDYVRLPEYEEARTHALSLGEVMGLFSSLPLAWEPGSRWDYSNSGYVLLSALMEEATGESWADCMTREVLNPASLHQTEVILPGSPAWRLHGYEWTDEGPIIPEVQDISHNVGAGALLSTAMDLFTFQMALEDPEGPFPGAIEEMIQPTGLLDGAPFEYGQGFWLADFGGHGLVEGEGYMPGFYHRTLSVPDEGIFVAVLTNSSGRGKPDDPVYIARWVASQLLGEPWPDYRAVEIPMTDLDEFVGVYRLSPELTIEVTAAEGNLRTMWTGGRVFTAQSAGNRAFFFPGDFTAFKFETGVEGTPELVWMTPDTIRVGEKTGIPIRSPIEIPVEILARFEGDYDLGFVRFRIFLEEDTLQVDDGRRVRALLPSAEDTFFPPDEDSRWEFREGEGEGMTLTLLMGSRVWEGQRIE